MKQSKGYIWVYSEIGRGTTFKVYLPHSAERMAAPAGVQRSGSRSAQAASETVLLVEDEAGVRRFSKRTLENAGYRVLEAANGDDGEKLFALVYAGPIDLVVTDVMMPGCGGPELLGRLRAQRARVARALHVWLLGREDGPANGN